MPRNVFESLIIILIAVTFGMVLAMPKYEEILDLRDKVGIKRADLKNREQYFQELEKIAKELKNYNQNLAKIKTALPVGAMAPSLANYIQSVSSQSGLILKNFTYGSAKAAPVKTDSVSLAIKSFEMNLSLSGSYTAFKDFLGKIEKSSRLIEVQEISFTASEGKKKTALAPPGVIPPAVENPAGNTGTGEGESNKVDDRVYEFNLKLRASYY